ncbi:Protein fam78a [Cichlidogyrus casuarinus]|uniref:Protein fam78a n=1 Tax=Cichlidogyrus casuarinus TaxID=1844966 RepID=A0ABD2Q1P5_9PLAT
MKKLEAEDIRVKQIRAFYDVSTGTEVKETEFMLFYKTQIFYCQAEVELPDCVADRDWDIGLVQACDYMYLANIYEEKGLSLWEFHPLKFGLRNLINDSDGRQYPFYSFSQSLHSIRRGQVSASSFTLQIKDYFHPSVVWELPYKKGVQLSEINRQQKFHIWLVAIKSGNRFNKEEVHVLDRIQWEYNLHLQVDPHMPVGERVRKIYDMQNPYTSIQDQLCLENGIPEAATKAPHCNAAQSLIWYPNENKSVAKILVPPKQVIVPWDIWVNDMLGPSVKLTKPSETCLVLD